MFFRMAHRARGVIRAERTAPKNYMNEYGLLFLKCDTSFTFKPIEMYFLLNRRYFEYFQYLSHQIEKFYILPSISIVKFLNVAK